MDKEVCVPCLEAQNKLKESRDKASVDGNKWAKDNGKAKYAIVLKPNRNGWKYIDADEPNLNARFPEVVLCYL